VPVIIFSGGCAVDRHLAWTEGTWSGGHVGHIQPPLLHGSPLHSLLWSSSMGTKRATLIPTLCWRPARFFLSALASRVLAKVSPAHAPHSSTTVTCLCRCVPVWCVCVRVCLCLCLCLHICDVSLSVSVCLCVCDRFCRPTCLVSCVDCYVLCTYSHIIQQDVCVLGWCLCTLCDYVL
jgi:hypothetical protein